MRQTKTILMALALLLPMAAAAQTATEVMSKASAKIKAAKTLIVKYTATYSESGVNEGTLTMASELFTMLGDGYGVWFDGTDMWTYSANTGETTLTEPTAAELLESNPMSVINNYEKNYTAQKKSLSGGIYTVELTAKNKKAAIPRALVAINTKTWLPTELEVTFSNGANMHIVITSVTETKTAIPKNCFKYPSDFYPGVEVIDLR